MQKSPKLCYDAKLSCQNSCFSFEISVDMLDYMDEILNFEETGESFFLFNILVDFFSINSGIYTTLRCVQNMYLKSISECKPRPKSAWILTQISQIIKHFLLRPEGNYVILYLRVAFFSLSTFQSVIFGYRARVE